MKVKVTKRVQVCHGDEVYRPDDVADVPDDVASKWVRRG
jgi:hypothetical protein